MQYIIIFDSSIQKSDAIICRNAPVGVRSHLTNPKDIYLYMFPLLLLQRDIHLVGFLIQVCYKLFFSGILKTENCFVWKLTFKKFLSGQ